MSVTHQHYVEDWKVNKTVWQRQKQFSVEINIFRLGRGYAYESLEDIPLWLWRIQEEEVREVEDEVREHKNKN